LGKNGKGRRRRIVLQRREGNEMNMEEEKGDIKR
jgi:hypothetical protein